MKVGNNAERHGPLSISKLNTTHQDPRTPPAKQPSNERRLGRQNGGYLGQSHIRKYEEADSDDGQRGVQVCPPTMLVEWCIPTVLGTLVGEMDEAVVEGRKGEACLERRSVSEVGMA